MRCLLLGLLVAVAGCAGTGTVAYHGNVRADVYAPDLVYVGPGVQVIADYDEPIFYSDNYYWRYYGGRWYRSSYYTGGWVYASPPYAVARIERPHAYVRYRPNGYVPRRTYRDNRPVYRDNRPVYRDNRPVYRDNRPIIRDHRTPPPVRHDIRQAPVQPQRPARPVQDNRYHPRKDGDRDRDRDRGDDVRDHRDR